MTTYRALCRLHNVGGTPADDLVNTFHFKDVAGDPIVDTETSIGEIERRLGVYFAAIDGFFGDSISSNVDVTFYDLADPKPRAPIGFDNITLDLGGALDSLPHEVCIVGSYRAEVGSGVDPSHRRGRTYVGPISSAFLVQSSGQHRIATANCQALADALENLLIDDQGGIVGVVYSETWHLGRGPTAGGPTRPPKPAIPPHTLFESSFPVVRTSVDNAFDTQRRRGQKASLRVLNTQ